MTTLYDVLVIDRADNSVRVKRTRLPPHRAIAYCDGYNTSGDPVENQKHELFAVRVPAFFPEGAPPNGRKIRKCFHGKGDLVIVRPAEGWTPKRWDNRPIDYEVLEVIGPKQRGVREFCMGFNHSAIRIGTPQWAMVE